MTTRNQKATKCNFCSEIIDCSQNYKKLYYHHKRYHADQCEADDNGKSKRFDISQYFPKRKNQKLPDNVKSENVLRKRKSLALKRNPHTKAFGLRQCTFIRKDLKQCKNGVIGDATRCFHHVDSKSTKFADRHGRTDSAWPYVELKSSKIPGAGKGVFVRIILSLRVTSLHNFLGNL